ncbi:uncharacterized protein BKCO1_37000190 [Diplodia corticola]|uniref:Fungal N-terminal domain-containing protein n=1 Tax=Diplodia corticola TaxID=236234 RepID=A0A1J9RIW6_9PEZI|nr:uncharacterized protein BKCO1_37000190 [Diplodia corticola]OJD32499.1 hypothetical protein BKCO1_37000190 [Diplodia corticola]
MSGIEAFGVAVGAAQLLSSVVSIISAVSTIQTLTREAPHRIRWRSRQLRFLLSVVQSITQDGRLQNASVTEYILAIENQIKYLLQVIDKSRNCLSKTPIKRVWHLFNTEKKVLQGFANLESEKTNLILYITSYENSCGQHTGRMSHSSNNPFNKRSLGTPLSSPADTKMSDTHMHDTNDITGSAESEIRETSGTALARRPTGVPAPPMPPALSRMSPNTASAAATTETTSLASATGIRNTYSDVRVNGKTTDLLGGSEHNGTDMSVDNRFKRLHIEGESHTGLVLGTKLTRQSES